MVRLTPEALIGLSDIALDARLAYHSGSGLGEVVIDDRYYESVKALVETMQAIASYDEDEDMPCWNRDLVRKQLAQYALDPSHSGSEVS